MAVFTTVKKNKLDWKAPDTSGEYYLKISDDYFLNIGSGFKLIIQPSGRNRTFTEWTEVTKTR